MLAEDGGAAAAAMYTPIYKKRGRQATPPFPPRLLVSTLSTGHLPSVLPSGNALTDPPRGMFLS